MAFNLPPISPLFCLGVSLPFAETQASFGNKDDILLF